MIGTLMLLDSGRWAIAAKDREQPYEITSSEVFVVEIEGRMRITRMEFAHGRNGGRYVSVDGFRLFEGMRAANGDDMAAEREPTANERAGMDWWNGFDEADRRQRLKQLESSGQPVTVASAWATEKATRR